MNKRAAYLFSVLVLLATFLATIVIGAARDRFAFSETEKFFERQTSTYLKEVTETERNDLLQENFRVVRNHLSSLREAGIFSEYSIEKGNSFVDQSEGFSKNVSKSDFLETDLAIEFSKGSGSKWGTVRYLTSRHYLSQVSRTLSSSLFMASIANSLFSVVAIGLLLLLFWRSGMFLSAHVAALLDGQSAPKNRVARWFWRPLLKTTDKIVSDFKETSSRLEKSRVDAQIGNLAAQVAHDIRSPITALRFAIGKKGEEAERVLSKAADRIEAIASDLLSARRSMRPVVSVPTDIKLADEVPTTIVDIIAVTQSLIAEKQCGIDRHVTLELVSSEKSLSISVNEAEYNRVLSNLVNNAAEALKNSAGKVKVFIRKYPKQVVVAITDDGMGIPPEMLEALNSAPASFAKTNGNGLGLSHARAVMRRHNGTLQLASRVGEGTIVSLTFPN